MTYFIGWCLGVLSAIGFGLIRATSFWPDRPFDVESRERKQMWIREGRL